MRTRSRWLVSGVLGVAVALWNPATRASGEAIAVIVNTQNPVRSVDIGDLRPMFQTRKISWGNSAGDVMPINLPEDNALRHEFDHVVLGLDPDRSARYWQDRRIRGGARPPARVSTTGAVLKVVASKAGAVGYVKGSEVNATVKVVAVISDGKLRAP